MKALISVLLLGLCVGLTHAQDTDILADSICTTVVNIDGSGNQASLTISLSQNDIVIQTLTIDAGTTGRVDLAADGLSYRVHVDAAEGDSSNLSTEQECPEPTIAGADLLANFAENLDASSDMPADTWLAMMVQAVPPDMRWFFTPEYILEVEASTGREEASRYFLSLGYYLDLYKDPGQGNDSVDIMTPIPTLEPTAEATQEADKSQ